MSTGNFSRRCSMETACAAASAPWICAAWKCGLSSRCNHHRHWRNGAIFGKSTNSVVCTGSAQSALYQQGCFYANGEFIQVHPTCIPATTSCASCRNRRAARVDACGFQRSPATVAIRRRSRRASAGIFSKSGIPSTATWFRATLLREPSLRCV